MKRKFKTLVNLLAMAVCSSSAWAQVTINPGDILVVDDSALGAQGAVIRIDPRSGQQSVVSQGGLFSGPVALAIEADGKIVTANRHLPGVVRVDPTTGTQTIVASGPPLIDPFGLALDADGNILVTDTACRTHDCTTGGSRGQAVYRINRVSGAVTAVSSGGYLDSPFGIAVEANGGILVTDLTSSVSPLTGKGGIIRIDPATGSQTVVSQGRLDFGCPIGIAVDANGMILNTVFRFEAYGCSPGAIFRANPATDQNTVVSPNSIGWVSPLGLTIDTDGSLVVIDAYYRGVYRVDPNTGSPTAISSQGFLVLPLGVAIARAATANLSVTLTGNAATVTAGDGVTYTYTITVNNSGSSPASGVTLTDSWPAGFTRGNTTASQGSCTSGGNFTCSLGAIAANGSATVTVNYTVPSTTPAGPQTNTVSVSSNTPDSNTGNKTASNTVTVNTSADLSVTNSDGMTSVTAGDGMTRTYTIAVSNAGPSSASNVTLTDTWPGGFTLGALTASQGSCTPSGGNFTCSLGDLAAGGSATVSASYTVPVTTPTGSQTNSVSVTSSTPDPNSSNNTASKATTVVTSADLSVTKSDGMTSVTAGDGMTRTYTITVSNAGPASASNVTLTDTWPGGFTLGTLTTSQGSCTPSGGNFTCSLGNLAAGDFARISASYTVPATTPAGSQTNSVSVTSNSTDPNLSNNTASKVTTVITSADLSVTNSDGVPTVTAGEGITRTYTIKVSNAGPSPAASVTLIDAWPSGFTLRGIATSQGGCAPGGGNFTCSLGNLAAGDIATISASYTVPATTPPGSQTNSVSVTSNTTDPNSSNNTASKTTTVVTRADLSVTKSDGVASVGILSNHTYTIIVSNAGPSMASDVTLTDYWPSGFTRGTISTSQGVCTQGSGNFICLLGNIAPGTSATVYVNYSVPLTSLLAGPQTNTVTVTSSTPDPNTANNSASKTTAIGLL